MALIWIVGGGKFGRKAALTLRQKNADDDIFIIERDGEKCLSLEKDGISTIHSDGVSFLSEFLREHDSPPDWIVPAVPVHVAFQWIRLQLKNEFEIVPVSIPGDIRRLLPNPIDGERGELFVSIADFFCPENCPEPEKFCTATRKPRPYDLYNLIGTLKAGEFTPMVIQSRQLAPGVGGYTPKVLFDALCGIQQIKSGKILLGTACRCHGVINAFKISKRAG